MVHHQKDIFLCKIIKAASLGENPTDQLMVHFTGTFLIRRTGIAVEYLRPRIRILSPILKFFGI